MNFTKMKKMFAWVLCVTMLVSAFSIFAFADKGWFSPAGEESFEPVEEAWNVPWMMDAHALIDLTDCSLDDWMELNVPMYHVDSGNVVAWFGDIPLYWEMSTWFAMDADYLYVAAYIVDENVVVNEPVVDPLDVENITNYNTGDNFQLALDFGKMISWTLENDEERADWMESDKAVFYSVGFRGDGEDVYVSVQECENDHILGVGDRWGWYGEDSGTEGKTFLAEHGWVAEFRLPLEELFYDACCKTYNYSYNDLIRQSIYIDEEWPLEIGLGIYTMSWCAYEYYGDAYMDGAFGLHSGQVWDDFGNPDVTWGAADLATTLTVAYEPIMNFTSPYILIPGKEPLELDPDGEIDYGDPDWGDEEDPDWGDDWGSLAYGGPVYINNDNTLEYLNGGFGLDALTDGYLDTAWHSDIYGASPSSRRDPTILTVDLGAAYTINNIDLLPYVGVYGAASVMPRAYKIEVFTEDGEWVEVASDSGVVAVGDASGEETVRLEYYFDDIVASQVRVVITSDSGNAVGGTCNATCIGEIEVWGYGDDEWEDEWPDEPPLDEKDDMVNVAINKGVSINNGNVTDFPLLLWGTSYLTDGTRYSAWVNNPEEIISSATAPTILTIDLVDVYEISCIELYPYVLEVEEGMEGSTMPTAFSVEVYSEDTRSWVEVGRTTDAYVEPGQELETVFTYEFDTVSASRVRVIITADSEYLMETMETPTGMTAIGEIAVWSLADSETEIESEDESEMESELDTEVESESEMESELDTEVESESEMESELDTEVESESEMESELDTEVESESEMESELDTEVESETEPATETESDVISGTEPESVTVAETKAPETEAPVADTGCASVVGLGAVAVLTAAAAAVALKKKE